MKKDNIIQALKLILTEDLGSGPQGGLFDLPGDEESKGSQLEQKPAPVVYVDMDGVLVDLFGGILEAAGQDPNDSSQKEIVKKLITVASQEQKLWKEYKENPELKPAVEFIENLLADNYNFWAGLKPLPRGIQLWDFLTDELGLEPHILTAPWGKEDTNTGDFIPDGDCVRAKHFWVSERGKNLPNPPNPSHVHVTTEKQTFAVRTAPGFEEEVTGEAPSNILIDDMSHYLDNWASEGGKAFQWDSRYSSKEISKIFKVLYKTFKEEDIVRESLIREDQEGVEKEEEDKIERADGAQGLEASAAGQDIESRIKSAEHKLPVNESRIDKLVDILLEQEPPEPPPEPLPTYTHQTFQERPKPPEPVKPEPLYKPPDWRSKYEIPPEGLDWEAARGPDDPEFDPSDQLDALNAKFQSNYENFWQQQPYLKQGITFWGEGPRDLSTRRTIMKHIANDPDPDSQEKAKSIFLGAIEGGWRPSQSSDAPDLLTARPSLGNDPALWKTSSSDWGWFGEYLKDMNQRPQRYWADTLVPPVSPEAEEVDSAWSTKPYWQKVNFRTGEGLDQDPRASYDEYMELHGSAMQNPRAYIMRPAESDPSQYIQFFASAGEDGSMDQFLFKYATKWGLIGRGRKNADAWFKVLDRHLQTGKIGIQGREVPNAIEEVQEDLRTITFKSRDQERGEEPNEDGMVHALQSFLQRQGFLDPDEIDGVWGNDTKDALEGFQEAAADSGIFEDIEVNGELDDATIGAMIHAQGRWQEKNRDPDDPKPVADYIRDLRPGEAQKIKNRIIRRYTTVAALYHKDTRGAIFKMLDNIHTAALGKVTDPTTGQEFTDPNKKVKYLKDLQSWATWLRNNLEEGALLRFMNQHLEGYENKYFNLTGERYGAVKRIQAIIDSALEPKPKPAAEPETPIQESKKNEKKRYYLNY